MRIALTVLSGLFALACAAAAVRGAGGGSGEVGNPHPVAVITAAPATFEIALGDEVRRGLELHLAQGSLAVARLTLRDLHPRAAESLRGVRIFVEKPDAGAGTPVGDPHYAGNFVLGLEDSQTMLWNIAPTLSRLWHSGVLTANGLETRKALRITFVPDLWQAAPQGFSLTFKSLTLELPAQP